MAKRITELSQIKKPASDMFLPLDRVEAGGTGTYSSTVRNVIGSVIGQGAEPPSGGGSFQLTSTELLLSHSINIPPANTIEGGQCSMWFTDNEHVSVDAYNDVNGMYKREDGVSLGKNKKYLRTLARAATGDYYAAFLVSSSDGMLYKPLSLSEPTVLVPINTGNDSENTSGLPVGVVTPYAGEKIPTGWLVCDGREVSRTQYADLFACVGDKHGAGDGSTTFNLPDMRGRVVAGLSNNNDVLSGAMNLGQPLGTQTHKLTIDEMPSHTHSYTAHHSLGASGTGGDAQLRSKSASTGTSGGSKAHNNVQPTIILNYIINTIPGGGATGGNIEQLIQNAVSQQIQNMNITGGAHVSATPPSSVSKGMMWWDTNTATMYVYDGLTWVQANK